MTGDSLNAPPATSARSASVRDGAVDGEAGHVTTAVVTIARPAHDLYAFWRDFANLPAVMENVERIETDGADRSTWTVKAPAGRTVQWDAVVTEDEADRLIGWQSVEGADIRNSGRIEFHDAAERGTVVRAVIAYDPPGGLIGELVAKLFQREPAIQARRDLRRFKQFMETGEISTSAWTRDDATDLPA